MLNMDSNSLSTPDFSEQTPNKTRSNSRLKIKVKNKRNSWSSSPYGDRPQSKKLKTSFSGTSPAMPPLVARRFNPFTIEGNKVKNLSGLDNGVGKPDQGALRSFLCDKLSEDDNRRALSSINEKENVIYEILRPSPTRIDNTSNGKRSPEVDKDVNNLADLQNKDVNTAQKKMPLDWSLITKLRITADQTFAAVGKVTSAEESKTLVDTTRYIRRDQNGTSNFACSIRKNLFFWIHPSNPISCNSKSTVKRAFFECPEVRNSYLSAWIDSFRSIFYLTRTGYCPYFYITSSTFSCIFRAAGVGATEMSCVLTPTTKGFRNALNEEGVEFTMPLVRNKDNSTNSSYDKATVSGVGSGHSDESDDEFLESIGLSKSHFPSVEEKKIQSTRAELLLIDNREESTIQIQGSATLAVFNYIMNSATFVDPTHSCNNDIPVIVSPMAFAGGTLQVSKLFQGPTQRLQGGQTKKMFAMDITGYILPNQLFNICGLLQRNVRDVSVSVTSHKITRVFNMPMDNSAGDEQHKPDIESTSMQFGLSEDELMYILQPTTNENNQIEMVNCCQNGFTTTLK